MHLFFAAAVLVMILVSGGFQAQAGISDELRAHAAPWVRSTSREVHLYHWVPRTNVGDRSDRRPIQARDPRVLGYVGYLKELFWNPSRGGGGVVGSGLYVAIDPVISQNYGGPDFVLIQFVMPARVRYLDIASGPTFSSSLQSQLRAAGCGAYHLESLFAADSVPACRSARDRLIRDLDVMAIRYRFASTQFSGWCSQRPDVAMVLFDDRAIGWDRLIAMTPQRPSRDPQHENRLIIRSLFEQARAPNAPWPELRGSAPETDVEAWAQRTLMSCGGLSEDR